MKGHQASLTLQEHLLAGLSWEFPGLGWAGLGATSWKLGAGEGAEAGAVVPTTSSHLVQVSPGTFLTSSPHVLCALLLP